GSCISSIPRIASAAKDHEHDIHNARPSNPVYTGPKFNSLLDRAKLPGHDIARLKSGETI
ncbi:hypothetical protein, partial [Paraburkholderia youngii]|uniref:hypothetical protein n=1 Tax=Paraburkholderia youngii TaxID=2782701 RepID=UPI001C3CA6BE